MHPDAAGAPPGRGATRLAVAIRAAIAIVAVAAVLGAALHLVFRGGGRAAAALLELAAPGEAKAWAHGVRSPAQARAAALRGGGLEIDVVHDAARERWEVRHPPGPAAAHDLPALLAAVPPGGARVWLDLKNLHELDPAAAAARLAAVVRAAGLLPGRVIVESPEVELLAAFMEQGFATAFYLPIEPGQFARTGEPGEALIMAELVARADAAEPDYVTSSLANRALLGRWFPSRDRLLWWSDPGGPRGTAVNLRDLWLAGRDTRVRAVLLRAGSP